MDAQEPQFEAKRAFLGYVSLNEVLHYRGVKLGYVYLSKLDENLLRYHKLCPIISSKA